ncbi:hypothetical protein QTP86_034431 [Hemibagrus guttatus]|nr:hypothetical protein QTP86_034431 [Hemibagrus guttatus]
MDPSSNPPDPLQDLVAALWQALAALPAPAPTPPVTTSTDTVTASSVPLCSSPMAQPAPYSGSAEDCNGFLLQCSLVLEMQPHLYPTARSKVAFVITQLRGQALLWAESLWSQDSPVTQSYAGFVEHFKEVFGKPSWDSSVGEELCKLRQGKLTVTEYAIQFRTLAAKSGWNEQALLTAYRQGLSPQVRLHLAAHKDAIGLERLIQLSIRVATRMQSCVHRSQDQSLPYTRRDRPEPVSPPEPAPEPMQLGTTQLNPAERQRRLTQRLCLYCGDPGHALPACPIRPLRPMVGLLHVEETTFLVLEESTADIILGRPWLEQHNPILSWSTGEVLKWGDTCFPGCFPHPPAPHSLTLIPLPVQATSIESPLVNQPLWIPTCYAPFSDVFCPKRASKLPPHRPWDCAIDLLPGEPVPRGRIYPLSIPEEKAMEEYIKEALVQGYIRPSTSPAASSFFFVAKKDGGLRPCIDYRALNRITMKFRYPLPLCRGSGHVHNRKRNYDIGNWELLAIKLALEEWRHWLEGARLPFLVLTDHKNLEYLRATKRLNPRQACWALFFTRFEFSISYRPGSKNTKADALSRMFTPEEIPETPEPILPENLIVSPITWPQESLPPANASTNSPPGCPPGSQYITRA